jgi:phenylacetate-CoA ligase
MREGAGEHLARLVKERIGVTANVAVVDANSLERSLGKAKRVVDKRALG